jgi:hypothetical protein
MDDHRPTAQPPAGSDRHDRSGAPSAPERLSDRTTPEILDQSDLSMATSAASGSFLFFLLSWLWGVFLRFVCLVGFFLGSFAGQ